MIIGHGAIAQALAGYDREDRIYFASGVANSNELDEHEYARELAKFLLAPKKSRRFVYFSSLCIYQSHGRYAKHKRMMEEAVMGRCPNFTIMRLGNIDWATNPNQLIPWIKDSLKYGRKMEILDEYRHILTKEEFLYWIDHIPNWNCEMNVTGELIKVSDLVARYQHSQRWDKITA